MAVVVETLTQGGKESDEIDDLLFKNNNFSLITDKPLLFRISEAS